MVLEDGAYWGLYGTRSASGGLFVSGFLHGNGASARGAFTSANVRDFGAAHVTPGGLSATYDAAAHTISGTVVTGQPLPFVGGPPPAATFRYDTPATLAAVAGRWSMSGLDGGAMTINVGSNGSFAGSAGNCAFTGAFTPRPSGRNVFVVTLAFGSAPCRYPGRSASGIGLVMPVGAGQTQLSLAATDAMRTWGTAATGTR